MDLWRIERELVSAGFGSICGVDEAGRGPLAGPVFAAAVILPFETDIPNLNDSKKLSEKTREILYDKVLESATAYGIGSAGVKEIDELNILRATFLAMNRAVDSLHVKPDIALVDGNRDPFLKCRSKLIIGGDGKSASIAAASILAKVTRDRYMVDIAGKYPQYMFEKHKGYGTKLHYEKLIEYGPSEIHRKTFLKKLRAGDKTNTQQRGKRGEAYARDYLKSKNYVIIAESFRSRFGEIDLIVKNPEYIVFVEVKLRKNAAFAHAREFVGREKQRKMIATAKYWLSSQGSPHQPRFDVIEVYAPYETAQPEIIHIENAF